MPRRLTRLQAVAGQGPMAIRAATRRLGRDVKRVHENIRALLAAGILDRTYDGQMVFPRDAAPVAFVPSAGDGRG